MVFKICHRVCFNADWATILNGKYIISAQGGTVCFKDTIKNHGTVPINVTIIDNLTIFLLHHMLWTLGIPEFYCRNFNSLQIKCFELSSA